MTKVFFPNLDGLRFVAFFMVYLWHAFEVAVKRSGVENKYISNIFYSYANGKTGVSIFFVLSGFLITYLILKEIQFYGKCNLRKFYIRRTLRIWPLYFLVLLVIFLIIPVIINLSGLDWTKYQMNPWYYFTFLSNFDVLRIYQSGGLDFLPSTVTWSVAIEEQFYLVWPVLFLFIKPRFYPFIFPLVIFVCYIFRIYNNDDSATLNFHTLSVCGDLGLGGFAAWLSIYNNRFRNFFMEQTAVTRVFFYVSGLVAMYVIQLNGTPDVLAWGRLLQTLFFTYIILDQNFSRSNSFKFSNNKFMTWMGKYTYGLYLYHPLVLVLMTTVIAKFLHIEISTPRNLVLIGVAAFPVCIAVSYVSYRFFESRFLKLKLRYSFISRGEEAVEKVPAP